MRIISFVTRLAVVFLTTFTPFFTAALQAQSNFTMRVMAANITSGNLQSYQAEGIRIFQGLKPDIVAVQEFQYAGSSAPNDLRTLVDTAFGTSFDFFVEPTGNIPNGIISRWPILAAGSWDDTQVNDRGFAWAQIDIPGSNDLYVVSVHLLTSGSGVRNTEATNLKAFIQSNFPPGAWIIVGGDCNTDSRGEAAITTFKTFLSDDPVPSDDAPTEKEGTNASRQKPYDFVLPSFSLTNFLTPVVLPSRSFPKGLVFDSRVYTPLTDVSPVQPGDSGAVNMQHMAVVKDFLIAAGSDTTNPPSITSQPQNQTNTYGANATFTVTASGTAPLAYQWWFSTTNIPGATAASYTRTNLQPGDAGNYYVVITNIAGSVTSSVAVLTVDGRPAILSQPQSVSVNAGANATFNVAAAGSPTLGYQWRFAGTNVPGATLTSFTRSNAQPTDAGNYSVVITNSEGSVTSAVAVLSVLSGSSSVIAQWNFNSVPPDGVNTSGTLVPSVGVGFASYVSGTAPAGSGEFATGDTVLDPAGSTDNSGWNTTTYPAASAGNKTAGVRFNVSTVGRQAIVVYWGSHSSNTGSKYGRLQYSVDGVNFTDVPTAFTNGTTFTRKTNSLAAFSSANDNANFAIRFVSEFESTAIGTANENFVAAGTTYATGGTMRYDMVTILGSPIVSGTAPVITNQPANVAANQGDDVSFSVAADGTLPLSFQWRFNASDIAGATTASYARSNVQPISIGNYSVVVSNAAGFAISSNATLTLIVPQPSLVMPVAGVLQWAGLSNLTYTVLASTNLSETNWSVLGTVLSPDTTIFFTNAPATNAQQFFRVTYP
ncbi:MAG: hypothetical protein HOP33_22210 [Verrucomicrobia bacterium]|nr:hypothetical protein [Verrucomicrobiota bacterium]